MKKLVSTDANIATNTDLELHFRRFRQYIIGQNQVFECHGEIHKMLYADWTAGGQLYWPIEETMRCKVGPWVANTHTETSLSGATMTRAYQEARRRIKKHVNARPDDVLVLCGTGMTGAMAKLQRIMGVVVPEAAKSYFKIPVSERPVVFISHMEHHSNHTSWLETLCDVVVIPHDGMGLISLKALKSLLQEHRNRKKIVSVTACSNVTGIQTPYHAIARMAHDYNAVCFVDFACSAPYVSIDMHPNDTDYLDAITFSPHKFLGGPGSSGVLIFNKNIYRNHVPDIPGGGTVNFTDPWGNHIYKKDIEEREDGGTPGFLQAIRTALAIGLKEEMGTTQIQRREKEINAAVFEKLDKIAGLRILAGEHKERLSIFSFYIEGLDYDLVTCLLNDKFGIQARGGCSCAGTYGHYLMNIDREYSERIRKESESGCTINKPGWVRISLHPTTTDGEVAQICNAVYDIATYGKEWARLYRRTNFGYRLKDKSKQAVVNIGEWFDPLTPNEIVPNNPPGNTN